MYTNIECHSGECISHDQTVADCVIHSIKNMYNAVKTIPRI